MSATIDERVVEMRFDNQQFEQGAKTSLDTLAKLRESLNMTTATKSLEELSKASGRFNLDGVGNAVETVNAKFSALEVVAFTTLQRITNKAIDAGESILRSLSIDQITAGYDKFETKTAAIQTIIAATGESIDEVTKYVDKLNWYTDETSYNLVDMISNIGKFTSNGIGLEDASNAMMGIGNAAALAGANAEKASHAMLGFSKAMAKGSLNRQHWMWIQTAGMDTKQFKEELINTAVELGTLKRAADGTTQTIKGGTVAFDDFETELKSGWATSEVLIQTLNKYTGDLNDVYERVNKTGETTSTVLDEMGSSMDALWLKSFRAAQEAKTFTEAIDSVKDAVSTGWLVTFEQIFGNYEEAKVLWTELANALWEVFAAGGAARNEMLKLWKSFGGREELLAGLEQAFINLISILEPIKEAFEEVFPPMTAKRLMALTRSFRDFMDEIAPTEWTLNRLKFAFTGVFRIVKIGINAFRVILKVLSPLFAALGHIADELLTLSAYFTNYIADVLETIDITDKLSSVINILMGVLRLFGGVLLYVVASVYNFVKAIKDTLQIRNTAKALGETVDKAKRAHPVIEALATAFEVLSGLTNIVAAGFAALASGVVYLITNISRLPSFIKDVYSQLTFLHPVVDFVTAAFVNLVNAIRNYPETLQYLAEKFNAVKNVVLVFFKTVSDNLKDVKSIPDLINKIRDAVTKFIMTSPQLSKNIEMLKSKMHEFDLVLNNFLTGLRKKYAGKFDLGTILGLIFGVALLNAVATISKLTNNIANLAGTLNTTFVTINKTANSIFNSFKPSMLVQIATSLTMLAGSLYLVSTIPAKDLLAASIAIGVLAIELGTLSTVMTLLQRFSKLSVDGFAKMATLMVGLSASVALLAFAFKNLEGVKLDGDLATRLITIAGLMFELAVASVALSHLAGPVGVSALGLVAFAFSITLVVRALKQLGEMDMSEAQKNLDTLGTMIVSISVLAVAAGRLRFGSAAALLLTIGSLYLVEMALKDIATNGISLEEIKANLDKFIPVLAALGLIAVALGMIGSNKGSLGAAATLVGFAIALQSVLKALDVLKTYSVGELLRSVLPMVGLMVFMGAVMMSTEIAGQHAHKAAIALIAVGITAGLLAGVLQTLADPAIANLSGTAIAALTAIGAICVATIAATQYAKGVNTGPILAAVAGMAVIVMALSVLYNFKDREQLIVSAIALGIGLISLAGSLALVSKAAAGISVKSILGLVAVIGALALATGAITMLAKIGDPTSVIAAAGALGIVLLTLGGALTLADASVKTAIALALMSVPLMVAASALRTLAEGDYNWDQIVAAAGSLSITMLALAFAANLANTALAGAGALILVGVAAIALASAFKVLGEVDYANLEPNLKAAGVALIALIGAAGIAGVLWEFLAPGLVILAAALGIIVLATAGFAASASAIAISIKMIADAFDQAGRNAPQNAENISNAIIKILTSIGQGAANMVTVFAQTLTDGFNKAFDSVAKTISAKVGPIIKVVTTTVNMIGTIFTNGFSSIPAIASVAFGGFTKNAATELSGLRGAGEDGVSGFFAGIQSKMDAVKDIGAGLADMFLYDGFGATVGWHSPWSEMIRAGVDGVSGLVNGATSMLGDASAAGSSVGGAFMSGMRNKIASAFNDMVASMPFAGALANEISDLANFKSKIGVQQQAKIDAVAWGDDSDEANVAADSVDNLTAAFDGLTDSMAGAGGGGGGGGGGGAAGAAGEVKDALTELTETIQNQMDVFSRYDAQFNIVGQSLINNMKSQIAGTKNWADSIKLLAKSGIDEGLLASLRDMGPQGASYVQAFLTMSREQLNEASSLFRDSLTEPAILASEILDGVATTTEASTEIIKTATEAGAEFVAASTESAEAAEYQVQRIQQAYENMRVSLAGTISNQISIFDKFDDSTEKTAEEVLQNMNSQLNGMDNWANMLIELAERGIDQGLLQHLADMGPAGYELTHAFVTMTNEQLQKAGELYQSSLTIDTTLSNRIVDSWKAVGVGLTDGLIDGVQQPDANGAIVAVADGMEEAFREETQTHSPSEVYRGLGESLIQGLIEGINSGVTAAKDAMTNVANLAFSTYDEHTPLEKYVELGARLCEGIAKGIADGSSVVKDAVVRVADDVYGSFASAWDIHSPSRRFAELGMYADEGLAMGLSGYAKVVSDSASNVGNETINSLSESLNKVGEVVSNDIDVDPTIRPVLDLSSVKAGAGQIDSMLSDQYMTVKGISGTIGGETSRLAALLSGMQTTDNQNGVINAIQGLRNDFAVMSDRIQRMQIVLDTGVVAGAVTPAVGDRLQHEAQMKGMVWA